MTPRLDARTRQLRANVRNLARMLHVVRQDPGEDNVHVLRTSTRRAGAMLQSLLTDGNWSDDQRSQAEKLLRQWKKLRRAAGAARDLDVHRGLLQNLGKKWGAEQQSLTEAAKSLDEWLADRRDTNAKKLVQQIDKRLAKVEGLAQQVLTWAHVPQSQNSAQPGNIALEDFARIAAQFVALDADNLHDFRKRTKEARYVAEAGGTRARPVERALKRIQDAIGDWHDFDALAGEARTALGAKGPLQELLEQKRDAQYKSALSTTERVRARLLGEYYSRTEAATAQKLKAVTL